MEPFLDIFRNLTVWCAFSAWVVAQGMKLHWHLLKTRKMDFSFFVRTGGMPSAHSALVCSLATSVGLRAGFASPLFAATMAFAAIVMFDAQSFRRAAGLQARLLNQIVEELFKEHHLSQRKLAELLGHTQKEVYAGMALGVFIALLMHKLAG